MRSALVPEVELGSGPDLTRYLIVCACSILVLVALAALFKGTVLRHLRRRASQRSLQVLDVLPLSGKQKLVVVRCYDRSFLLGLGEKEVRSIAELELELEPMRAASPAPQGERGERERLPRPFSAALQDELVAADSAVAARSAPREQPEAARASLREGVVA